jgi:Zn-dependent protease
VNVDFSGRELRDLGVAWVALAVAFTLFIASTAGPSYSPLALVQQLGDGLLVGVFVASFLTVGVAFLLHELAHKVVAIHYDQVAEFRADYTMLALAVGAGLAGFLFAAPGAVYHRGYLNERENAFIALAGPATNVLLAGVFAPLLFLGGFLGEVGQLGVTVNAALAAFNMIPFGPLDGKKVRNWSTVGFGVSFLVCAGLAVFAILYVGFPY